MGKLTFLIIFLFSFFCEGAFLDSVRVNNFPAVQQVGQNGIWTLDSITNPVTVNIPSIPLATNAATESTLQAINNKLPTLVGGKIPVDVTGGTVTVGNASIPVTGAFFQATQPVSLASVPTHAVTGSGNFTVVQPTGTNLHTVIDNASIAVTGSFFQATQPVSLTTIPLATNAATDRTTAAAPYSNRLSDGTAFYDARQTRALTSADQVTIANQLTGFALDTSVNSLLKPASTLAAVTTVGSITNSVTIKADTPANQTNALKVDGSAVTQPVSLLTIPLALNAATDRISATAPYSNRLSDGIAFYDARQIRALTSTDQVTVANQITGFATQTTAASIDTKTPALGQTTMAGSQPVAIASNQSAIPVTGAFFQATQPVSLTTIPLATNASTLTEQQTQTTILNTIATNTGAQAIDTLSTGSITALNGVVSVNAQGSYTVVARIAGTWVATLVAEGLLADGATWQQLPMNIIQATQLPYQSAFSITTNSVVSITGGGYTQIRIRASAFTSGTVTVNLNASLAQQTIMSSQLGNWNFGGDVASGAADTGNPVKVGGVFNTTLPTVTTGQRVNLQTDNRGRLLTSSLGVPNDLIVSTTAAAGTAVTATLPAVAAKFHYIDSIEITLYSAAARTGGATPIVCTTTNLAGAMAYTFGTAAAIGTTDVRQVSNANRPIKSSAVNTATTIACPAVAGGLWRINVVYSSGF